MRINKDRIMGRLPNYKSATSAVVLGIVIALFLYIVSISTGLIN